jgi:signal transduction histidine kinase
MWLAILPFIGASFLGRRGFYIGAIGLFVILTSYFIFNSLGFAMYPYQTIDAFFIELRTNLFVFSAFTISVTYSFIKNEHVYKEKILVEKEKNENLLRILFHDLANPMQAIKLLLKKLINNRTPEENEKIAHQLDNYCERVNEVLHHVKKMKAIEDGKISLDMRPYMLHDAINKAKELFNERLQEKEINFVITNSLNDTQVVLVDHVYFVHQVLGNIISNSIKFSDIKGKITISWEKTGIDLVIIISDNGIGMPQEILNNLFKEHKTISRKGTFGEVGTGYGMPLVKTFVEQFNGSIVIESIEKTGRNTNHGTTTKLHLPIV